MGNTVRTYTRKTYILEHGGKEFNLTFEPVPDSEEVKITNRGKDAEVRYLVYDADSRDDYFKEQDSGEFYCADPRSLWYRPLDDEALEDLTKENPGRVFFINKYEHSLVKYYRQGTASAECPWDTSRGYAVYVAPDDCPNPEEYCDAIMEELSDWCNGNIFGCVTDTFKRIEKGEYERVNNDACWGFIGYEHAKESLKDF